MLQDLNLSEKSLMDFDIILCGDRDFTEEEGLDLDRSNVANLVRLIIIYTLTEVCSS